MNQYTKFAAQIIATAATALIAAMQAGPLTAVTWINVGLSAIGAVMVVGGAELPSGVWKYTKTYLSALSAALVVLSGAVSGFDRATILQALVAALAVLGVAAVPGPVVQAIGTKPGALSALRRTPTVHGKHEG